MRNIRLLLLLLLLSCSNNLVNNISNAPKWYVNPPQNNHIYLYGVGYGSSLQEATKISLNNIAEKILVTVSSSLKINNQESTVNDNSEHESRQEQDITLQVKEIDFTDYQLVKSDQSGKTIYSLVKVKRKDLTDYYFAQIKKDHIIIKAATNDLNSLSYIEQFTKINKVKDLIIKNETKLELLKILDADSKIFNKYIKYYNLLLKKQIWLKNNIILKVVAQASDQRIADVIKKSFNDLGIKVEDNLNQKNKQIFLLRLTSNSRTQYIYNSYITKINIDIKLIESFGSQIAAKTISAQGSSLTNKVMSFDAAIVDLQKNITKFGIMPLIGL